MGLPPGKPFDLNIEEILENWETYDGIREVIANAINEQTLKDTKEITIYKDKQGKWQNASPPILEATERLKSLSKAAA